MSDEYAGCSPHSRNFARLVLIASVVLVGCDGCGDAGAQQGWYNPADLFENLRQSDRARAAELVEPLSLDALPFYDMAIVVADNQETFTMTEEVYFTNNTGDTLETVVLRLYANAVGEAAQVRLTGSECVGAECQVHWDQGSVFEVRPSSELAPGDRLRIRLNLEGTLTEIDTSRTNMLAQAMEGLQRQGAANHGDYGLLSQGSGIASMGNFYAMVAAYRDGDWVRSDGGTMGDLGADSLCHFRANVRSAARSKVASTGAITRDETHLSRGDTPGFQETQIVAGMVRNFGLVLGPGLEVATRQVGDVAVQSWFLPAHRAKGEAALDAAVESLRVFEQRFGPYPFTEFELAEASLVGGAGGVEFSGLVTIATMFYQPMGGGGGGLAALLGNAGPVGNMMDGMLEFVVAHEVAHQWWHGIVGSDARLHPFVDESLAQYSAMLYLEERYGADRARQEGERQVAGNYHMMRMQGEADAAVDQPASAFASETAYAGIVYGKGPYMYGAIRDAIGDDAFFDAISDYVAEYRFGVAPPRALLDYFARTNEAAVRRLETRWLEETHGDDDLGQRDMNDLMNTWGMGGGLGSIESLESMGNLEGIEGLGGVEGLEGLGRLLEQLGGQQGGGVPNGGLQDMTRMLEQMTQQLERGQ